MDCCEYRDVVITPFLVPKAHYTNPSLIGNISVDIPYAGHWQFRKRTSRRCRIGVEEAQYTVEEPCIYCGYLFPGYGHFILESLAMLYFIKRMPAHYKLVFSYAAEGGIKAYQKDILEKLGIGFRRISVIKDVALFRRIWIPPAGYALGSWWLDAQQKSLEIIDSSPVQGRNLYISRSKYRPGRGAVNEDKLEEILLSRGWRIMYPEKLSFMEQIKELADAETVFCISGSALHSIVFLGNIKSRFIVIPRGHGTTYNMIAEAKAIKEYYLFDVPKEDLTPNIKNPVSKTVSLDIRFIEKILEDTSDFRNLGKSAQYFRNPQKVMFDYRTAMEEPYPFSEEDHAVYRILYADFQGKTTQVHHCVVDAMARNLVPEYAAGKIFGMLAPLDMELSIRFLEHVLSRFPRTKDATRYMDQICEACNKTGDGQQMQKDAVYRMAGMEEMKRGNYLLAVRFLSTALKQGGVLAIRGTISEIYNRIGMYREAVSYSQETVDLTNGSAWSYVHLAISYYNRKDFARAHESIMRASEAAPENPWCLKWKKRILKSCQNLPEEGKGTAVWPECGSGEDEIDMMRQLLWEQKYRNAVMDSEWLLKKSIFPGDGTDAEVGYHFFYFLYRIMDEYHPRNILEFNFGQSTKMIAQYAAGRQARHVVLEQSRSRVEHFLPLWGIPWKNTIVYGLPLQEAHMKGKTGVAYQEFDRASGSSQYDLVVMKCPSGKDIRIHMDLLPRLPGILHKDFAILMDHVEDDCGKMVRQCIVETLKKNGIGIIQKDIRGFPSDACVLASEGWEYVREY